MKGLFDISRAEEGLAPLKLVGATVGQTRVQPYVLLVVGEAPEGDPLLQVLRYLPVPAREEVLGELEGYVGGDASRRQLLEPQHLLSICKNIKKSFLIFSLLFLIYKVRGTEFVSLPL